MQVLVLRILKYYVGYHILLLIARIKRVKIKKKYYFSICAIFKNESLSLKEWIEYHMVIGVQHFYLYNNQSFDNYWHETFGGAFIDLDEYICLKRCNDIKIWIKKYENYPSIVLYWKQFGSSGKIEHYYSKLIIEQYTECWDKFYDIGKSVFNTNFCVYTFSAKYIHTLPASIQVFRHKFLIPSVNGFKKFIRFR